MQFNKTLLRLLFIFFPCLAMAQTTYLTRGDKQEIMLERLEIKAQRDSVLNLSKTKPYSRETYMEAVRKYVNGDSLTNLTEVDNYYLRSLMANNPDWLTPDERAQYLSRKPILKHFYTSPAALYEAHIKDFDLVVNPLLNIGYVNEKDNDSKLFYNARGVSVRGKIADRIGFAASLTDNQERSPAYVQQWMAERSAVPNAGYYLDYKDKGGVDYFDGRGYITFGATKYVDIAFGYDRNFIGNGQRSLFLSDFSNNTLFLKLNTRIWKLNYQNIFMELKHGYQHGMGDKLIGKKYAAVHHLDVNVTPWLNVGLFEGVVFGRLNKFEFTYLVPVIFLRSMERDAGSPDNAMVGFDFKANVAKTAQFYGQLLMDEFKLKELTAGKGWWANKFGYQLGAKYIDAFTVKNLDLQAEWNYVRPFTYSHYDSVANYSHYNQPLAHPLMANFNEFIGVVRYRPIPKLSFEGKLVTYLQGKDSTANVNFGSNLFLPNSWGRNSDYDFKVGSGWKTNVSLINLLFSYELRENLFIDLNAQFRRQKYTTPPVSNTNSTVVGMGVRWNMGRRDFLF
ncbi:MAG: hypothetical protein QM727_06440 [Niabella sp.]